MNTFKQAKRALFLSVLTSLALASGASLAAGTQTGSTAPVITVKYDPVDAATPAGAQALYKRIKAAASKVCAPYESRELPRQVVWQKCYATAVTRAVAAVHQPVLTALHERSGEGRSANPQG